jgi:hypothetical protein
MPEFFPSGSKKSSLPCTFPTRPAAHEEPSKDKKHAKDEEPSLRPFLDQHQPLPSSSYARTQRRQPDLILARLPTLLVVTERQVRATQVWRARRRVRIARRDAGGRRRAEGRRVRRGGSEVGRGGRVRGREGGRGGSVGGGATEGRDGSRKVEVGWAVFGSHYDKGGSRVRCREKKVEVKGKVERQAGR